MYKTKASNFRQTLYVYIFFRIIFLVRLWNLYRPHYISICNSTDKATYLQLTDTLVTYPYLYMSKNFENIEKIKNYFSISHPFAISCLLGGAHFAYHPFNVSPTNIKKDIGISDTLYHTWCTFPDTSFFHCRYLRHRKPFPGSKQMDLSYLLSSVCLHIICILWISSGVNAFLAILHSSQYSFVTLWLSRSLKKAGNISFFMIFALSLGIFTNHLLSECLILCGLHFICQKNPWN